jgi:hypothetical protein
MQMRRSRNSAGREIYARLGASWDAGRVRRRLRSLGVRRRLPAVPAERNGWAARTELAVVAARHGVLTVCHRTNM